MLTIPLIIAAVEGAGLVSLLIWLLDPAVGNHPTIRILVTFFR
jgi:hypothetical protein